ncbi:MAG: DUF1566 domain-containing protein [Polyangiaceae bacterium]|nr:DUF1566 domain-containing protein [Polyangiaceae bacterium]
MKRLSSVLVAGPVFVVLACGTVQRDFGESAGASGVDNDGGANDRAGQASSLEEGRGGTSSVTPDGGRPLASGGIVDEPGGASSVSCAAGTILCSGACVPVGIANCGSCGRVCGQREECVDSSCQCRPPYTDCEGDCVDLTSDSAHCGRCGSACADPKPFCSESACVGRCPSDQTECDRSCVDLDTNDAHCGSCSVSCGPDETCKLGECTCTAPLQECSGECVDKQLDPSNCGACGRVCASGRCTAGKCVPSDTPGAGGEGGVTDTANGGAQTGGTESLAGGEGGVTDTATGGAHTGGLESRTAGAGGEGGGSGTAAGGAHMGGAAGTAGGSGGPPNAGGQCAAGSATSCDDGDACTDNDVCDGSGNCVGTPKQCNDHVACTIDVCQDGDCVNEPDASHCYIDKQCRDEGEANPSNACQHCSPSADNRDWTEQTNSCLIDGVCHGHGEINLAVSCLYCNASANPGDWTLRSDSCLIDGDACYTAGATNPLNACQYCDPLSNNHDWTDQSDSCLIGGVCYHDGASNPSRPCQYCDASSNSSGWTLKDATCLISNTCFNDGDENQLNSCEVCDSSSNRNKWTAIANTWYDPQTELCWQNPATSAVMNLTNAIAHCEDVHWGGKTDWHLPYMDELFSLIRGCQDGVEGDASDPSLCVMTPYGCAKTTGCNGSSQCASCDWLSGPDADPDGCYWVPELGGPCHDYWSLTPYAPAPSSGGWYVNYRYAIAESYDRTSSNYVRCVRGN